MQLNAALVAQLNSLGNEKASRTAVQKKISSRLMRAIKAHRGDPQTETVPGFRSSAAVEPDGTVLVDIKARVTPALLEAIEAHGGTVINSFAEYDSVRAQMPIDAVESIAAIEEVRHIGPAARFILNKVNTSEGDVAHSAATARNKSSITGSGIKVGVLSDSVDYLAAVQATGDLPGVTVLANAPGYSGEGTAMLEIVHDLAPGAQLYFATAANGQASFANNIKALANAGCKVIIDDIFYLDESPFQDDIISRAVNTVTSQGVLYFSSAGNAGNLNDGTAGAWEGNYRGMSSVVEGYSTVHDFGGGDWSNRVTDGTPFCYTLQWTDPLGGSANDYDLYLVDPALQNIVDASDDIQDGNDDPIEGICPDYDTTGYHLLVARWSGADRFIHLSANRGRFEHRTAGQIKGHAAATDAFAVSAVSARAKTTPFLGVEPVETFTSDGPRRVFFYPNGTPITPGNYLATGGMVRNKPDITAADGVKTATPGFNPFYGTSAAAPHAGAIAALMLSRRPNLTIADVRQLFQQTALDIEAPGWDRDSGYGILMADRVLAGGLNTGMLHLLLLKN